MALLILLVFFVMLLIVGIAGIRIVNQYERGVLFTLGKYTGTLSPGLNWVIPGIQWVKTVDIRQKTLDLKEQEVITKDQVNLSIDGVIFYRVEHPEKVILNVQNLQEQLENKATSELKEILGNMTMAEGLTSREKIASTLMKELEKSIKDVGEGIDWGVVVKSVQINNIQLPENLVRAMAKQAEAEREKGARIIKAEGEFESAKKFKQAADMYRNNPPMLRLRELQTYQEIGAEKNSFIIVVPDNIFSNVRKR